MCQFRTINAETCVEVFEHPGLFDLVKWFIWKWVLSLNCPQNHLNPYRAVSLQPCSLLCEAVVPSGKTQVNMAAEALIVKNVGVDPVNYIDVQGQKSDTDGSGLVVGWRSEGVQWQQRETIKGKGGLDILKNAVKSLDNSSRLKLHCDDDSYNDSAYMLIISRPCFPQSSSCLASQPGSACFLQ